MLGFIEPLLGIEERREVAALIIAIVVYFRLKVVGQNRVEEMLFEGERAYWDLNSRP